MKKEEVLDMVIPRLQELIWEDMTEWSIGATIEQCIESFDCDGEWEYWTPSQQNANSWVDEVCMSIFEEAGIHYTTVDMDKWILEICPSIMREMRDYLIATNRDVKIRQVIEAATDIDSQEEFDKFIEDYEKNR